MALSGPEMLLKNLLGIDPNEMRQTINGMIRQVNEIHSFMVEIRGRLDRIENQLGIENINPHIKFLPKDEAANG